MGCALTEIIGELAGDYTLRGNRTVVTLDVDFTADSRLESISATIEACHVTNTRHR